MSEEWIEWKGGECPVDPETIVWVRFRFNDTVSRKAKPAKVWNWPHHSSGGDIIAYRICEPYQRVNKPVPTRRTDMPS